ncbi:efflux RND transporter periplasmic adaptor subunit, partial [Litorivivens sp.]
ITRIEREGAQRYLPILAPTSLVLISSQLTEGAAIKKGQQVLQAASVERVWVEAFAYEQDWSLLQEGMQARVELANSAREYESQVALISPIIRGSSRSARVRLDLDNPKSELLPGQFADVWLYKKLGSQLLVPLDAVMVTGERRIVFKDLGQGRLKPVVVKTGYSDGDRIVIREGLEEGDRIVTSGVFLIAAESRLKLGPDSW